MVNFIVLVLRVSHELLELLAKEVNFSEIKWTEISKERLVHQVVINAEVKGMLA